MKSLKVAIALVAMTMLSMQIQAQSPAGPGFIVDLSLSPRAAAELQRRNEGIVVAISYGGDPRPAYQDQAEEAGIDLGREELIVPGRAGEVEVPDSILQRGRLSWISGPPRVAVSVYSARRSGRDNLLNCEGFEAPVAEIGGTMQSINCRLIGE